MKLSIEQIAALKASIAAGEPVYWRFDESSVPKKIARIYEDGDDARAYFVDDHYVLLNDMLDPGGLPTLEQFFVMRPVEWTGRLSDESR